MPERPGQVADGAPGVALVVEAAARGEGVAEAAGGGERGAAEGEAFGVPAGAVEVGPHQCGELPGDFVVPVFEGVADGGEQVGALSVVPAQRLLRAAEGRGAQALGRRRQGHPGASRGEQRTGGGRALVQAPGVPAVPGPVAGALALLVGAPLGGEQPDQVVEAVAAGGVFGEEMGVRQAAQDACALGGVLTADHLGDGRREVDRGAHREQPEQPRGRLVERPVGEREDRAQPGGRAVTVGVEDVQAGTLGRQFGREAGEVVVRAVAQPGDGEADGQREVAAGVEQPGDGVLVGRDPFGAEDPVHQRPPLGRAEVDEFDPLRPFADDEAGEPVAAGHDHRAAPVPGSSGRTCSASSALSSTIRTRRPARVVR